MGQPDEALMQMLCNGDRQALEVLYSRYFQRLCAFVYSVFLIPNPEDLVQDVFLKIMEKPDAFMQGYKFQTWIFTLAANKCKNHRRSEIKRDLNAADHYRQGLVFQHHENLDAALIRSDMQKALASLNEKEKCIYMLKYEYNFTYIEIAELLEIPEGSVKSGMFYILKKMTRQLQIHLTK